jgi:hypothetical protein
MMRVPSWVQTIACTKPIARVKSRWPWEKIYDGDEHMHMQIWICRQDLKEDFVHEARQAFGKCLDQVVRLGAYPEVLYPCVTAGSEE